MADQFIPPWQNKPTLARNLCISEWTVDNWAAQGIIPPARKKGGRLMWKWSEVDEWLTKRDTEASPDSEAERIRNGTRAAAQEIRPRH